MGFASLNPRLFIDFSCGKVRGMRLTGALPDAPKATRHFYKVGMPRRASLPVGKQLCRFWPYVLLYPFWNLKSENSPPKKFKKILQIPKISLPLHRKSKRADSVAQLVEQMTLNHWVESSSLSGVTKGSIRPMNSSENHWFSEVFLFTPLPNRRNILKLRVCKKVAIKFSLQTAPSLGYISLFFNTLQWTVTENHASSWLIWRVQ